MNPQSLLDNLRDLYGPKITAADIKAYCAQHDVTYQTVTKYLLPYKKGIGKWNLTVTQQLEKNYEAPAAQPAIEQNLIPEKDDSFVKFGNFGDLKKNYSVPSILSSVHHGSFWKRQDALR